MDNLKKVFAVARTGQPNSFNLGEFVERLDQQSKVLGGPLEVSGGLSSSISLEGFGTHSPEQIEELQTLYANIVEELNSLGFESYNERRGEDSVRVTQNQAMAATITTLVASQEGAYRRRLLEVNSAQLQGGKDIVVVNPNLAGPHGTINLMPSEGVENYNEKPTRDFRVISIAYNLEAARQDAFAERLYPTVVQEPTSGGVVQHVPYLAVPKNDIHPTTGALMDTQEVNMVEAFRDPSVLEDQATALIPIVAADNSNIDNFVSDATIGHRDLVLPGGEVGKTGALVIGRRFDLLGISNRSQLVAGSVLDISDTIDPALRLKNIYLQIGDADPKVVRYQVERMPMAVFQPSLVEDTRLTTLNFYTEDLVLNGDTKTTDGSTNDALDEIATRGWELRLGISVTGNVSLSMGNTQLNATSGSVERVVSETGEQLALSGGDVAALIEALGEIKVIGYDLDAWFTNTNRRERGQIVQARTVQFRYPIRMHSPITLPMSTLDEAGPAGVVKGLTVATNVRNSINAVTRALNYLSHLREVVGQGHTRPKYGMVEGALSVMMRPTYRYHKLDLTDGSLDSIRSGDRWNDVTQVIMNTIKSLLFPAYRESNIEAAFQTITGNADERPMFIIATDKEIANYLMQSGDSRTLGPYLKYDIVATNNEKFDGKIMVIPTREKPTEADVLNWGQFYYIPTLVADLPISRRGQVSREIAAIPINLHVNNIPFAIEIDVVGLGDVMRSSVYNALPGLSAP